MNEFFAADPEVCRHSSDLKLLLGAFGPFTGRYLADYPKGWSSTVERLCEGAGDIELARIRRLLVRARASAALVTRTNLPWNSEHNWLVNALLLLGTPGGIFDGLIASQARPPAVHRLDELDLPPTAEERIAGTAIEYGRVSKILLLLSPEIAVVDPFLDPRKRSCFDVLHTLFAIASKGRCEKITLWVRATRLFDSRGVPAVCSELETSLGRLAELAGLKPGTVLEMILVGDEDRKDKMHARMLLSIKGGIRFDQGFSQLPKGRHNDVMPLGKASHDKFLGIHFEGRHDMKIVNQLGIKV